MEYRIKFEDADHKLLDDTNFGSINEERDDDELPYKASFIDPREKLFYLLESKSLKSDEKLTINRKAKLNPLNQPPRTERVFSIVFYVALCYVLNYLAIAIVMNIIMLASGEV